MIYKDYYKDLGIEKTASPAEIKKAFRTLANKYHPDKARGDRNAEEKFKVINEAHKVLSDPEKRKKYDRFGADWKQYEEAGAQPGGFDWSKYADDRTQQGRKQHVNDPVGVAGDVDMSELFEMLFGGRTGRGIVVIRGEDLETETTISLEEVFHGASRLIQINGQTIRISIKPGISEGQVLRIAGKGGSGHGGGAGGDLYLRIRIAPHQTFLRDGDDLRADLPVDIYSAILGGKTGFVTLKGSVAVTIPKGTPNGRELRLRGLGMPVYGKKNAYGNLLLKVSIVLPERLTEEELHLFGRLAALRNGLRENIAPS